MILSKETLIDLNHTQEKTLTEIGNIFHINPREISKMFDGLGIEKRKFFKTKRKISLVSGKEEEFKQDYLEEKIPLSLLQDKWNLSEVSLKSLIKDLGLDKRKRKDPYNKIDFSTFDKDLVLKLFNDQTKTIQNMSDALGISTPTFKRLLVYLKIIPDQTSFTMARFGKETILDMKIPLKDIDQAENEMVELTPREKKLLAKRGYTQLPPCQLEGCDQPVKIGRTNGFYLCCGCCDDHIRKINSKRSGESQIGKTRSDKMTGLSPEQSQKLKEKGYILIDEIFSDGYKIKVQCPSCQTIFSRSVHNALTLCAPLCKKCADKKRGDEYSIKFQENYDENKIRTFVRRSKIEKTVEEWLRLEFPETTLKLCDRRILSGKEIDLFLPDHSLGIEVNGVYCHSEEGNPETKNTHYWKFKTCEEQGIHLISLWDEEWSKKNEIVKSIIRCQLNKFETVIPARKCQLVLVDSLQAKQFYDMNHIQGASSFSGMMFNPALIYNSNIVGMMSFGSHPRTTSKTVLTRCAFQINSRVIGGKEKLFSWFKKEINVPLLSWSDSRWFSGQMYPALGFTENPELKPDYCYYRKDLGLMPKQRLKKQKLMEMGGTGETERELASSLKFLRLWDCGKKTWVWNPN